MGTRGILTLVTASYLESPPNMWESPYVHIFHIGAVDRERDLVFRLASGTAGVAADALSVIYDLRPLDARCWGYFCGGWFHAVCPPDQLALHRQLLFVPVQHAALQVGNVLES